MYVLSHFTQAQGTVKTDLEGGTEFWEPAPRWGSSVGR